MKKFIRVWAIAGLFISTQAIAQSNIPADSATVSFVNKAARGGKMEVVDGNLAKAKAQRADVRDFGALMVKDHSAANDKLMNIVAAKSIVLANNAPMRDDELSKLSGEAFDKAYVKKMLKDHEEDVALFEKAAGTVPNKAVREFASQTLPTLKEHLEKIKAIAAQMQIK